MHSLSEKLPWTPAQCRSYWTRRGRTYKNEVRLRDKFYAIQANAIAKAAAALSPRCILEVGCGFGRVTEFLAREVRVPITGIDLSFDQLKEAAKRHPDARFMRIDLFSATILPTRDLAVCSELLLHIPPTHVERVLDLVAIATNRLIVDFDPAANVSEPLAAHCFIHDVRQLLEKRYAKLRTVNVLPRLSLIVAEERL